MFKLLNNFYINVNHIIKIVDGGVDPKDNKNYCLIYIINDEKTPLTFQGTIEEAIEYFNK